MGSCYAHIYARLRRKWSHTFSFFHKAGNIASIRDKKSHVYRIIILKQMADHNKRCHEFDSRFS